LAKHVTAPATPEPKWDERLRGNPVVIVAAGAIAAMIAVEAVRVFLTTTLPWLLSFVDPVRALLQPVSEFLAANADLIAVGIVSGIGGAIVLRFQTSRRMRRELAVVEKQL
jgi:hypothetical protein